MNGLAGFTAIKADLNARGMTIRQGTITDATLIAMRGCTKNKERRWNPELHQTQKGNQWSFAMSVHASVDKDSGLIR